VLCSLCVQAVAEKMRTAAPPAVVPYAVMGTLAGDVMKSGKSLGQMSAGLQSASSGECTRVMGGGTVQVSMRGRSSTNEAWLSRASPSSVLIYDFLRQRHMRALLKWLHMRRRCASQLWCYEEILLLSEGARDWSHGPARARATAGRLLCVGWL
jgi:hypothetical protein